MSITDTEPLTKTTSSLGTHLAAVRAARKLSLRRVEELSNKQVSNGYLNQIETGKILQPSPNILYVLADVLQTNFETLMELAGYMSPKQATDTRHGKLATLTELDLTEGEEKELVRYVKFLRENKGESR